MIAPYNYRGGDGAVGHQLVEADSCPVPLARTEPADARGKALEVYFLSSLRDPTLQPLVLGEKLQYRIVGRRYVGLLARERGPPEWSPPLAEKRPHVRWHEPWIAEGTFEAAEPGLPAQGVAVVEYLSASLLEADHRCTVACHRGAGFGDVALRVGLAQLSGGVEAVARWDIARKGVVGGGLVRDDVGDVAAFQQCRKHLGRVAEDSYRQWLSDPFSPFGALYGPVEVVYPLVQVAVGDAPVYPTPVHLDAEGHALVHGYGERLGAAHAAEARGEADAATQRSPEALLGDGGERLVGALEYALRPDVDPRPCGHLAVHR